MNPNYPEFFTRITNNPPFPYQAAIAERSWPQLVDVATGLGKTAAIVVAWLYKRLVGDQQTGRRLIYCLPMRVLVDQTANVASGWCTNAAEIFQRQGLAVPTVHKLMGADVDAEWVNQPEDPHIVVGTQDMLLSRALNRGYALSRYKWPMHFALLNNDCLWVFDETQLIGVGNETSAQMQGFREKLGTHAPAHTVWMSATLSGRQLETVDHKQPANGWNRHTLSLDDLREKLVQRRVHASKPISRIDDIRLDTESDKKGYIEAVAAAAVSEHSKRGGLTLIVVNRVRRAQALYQALRDAYGRTAQNTALVHSRFRASDRRREEAILHDHKRDRIVVATQAVEAGVDVSARTMFTELAPWPSLVQRFGRCNRFGDDDAAIFWIDIDTEETKAGLTMPYESAELDQARELLGRLAEGGADAGPEHLREMDYEPPAIVRPVIRRRDLLDLFDTTPDLSGNDIDISRYVRDGNDTDVQVYWRAFEEWSPPDELSEPVRDELCRVSIAAARDFLSRLDKLRRKLTSGSQEDRRKAPQLQAWRWNPLEKQWEAATRAYPGQVFLLHSRAGGYDPWLGWIGEVGPNVTVPQLETPPDAPACPEGYGSDPGSIGKHWVNLADHLKHVRDETEVLVRAMGLNGAANALTTAGLWHDVGKAHDAFQHKLLKPLETHPELTPSGDGPWAKSNHRRQSSDLRKHFRHELASMLAWLAAGDNREPEYRDLVAYLIAAHHGKVRMSLRSLPGETEPQEAGRLFARGVWDRDVLPAFELPDGRQFDGIELDLSLMQLGEGSWLERTLTLRDAEHLGPFRLALLETILRIGDGRASHKEEAGAYHA